MHPHHDNRVGLALSLASSLEPSDPLAQHAKRHGAQQSADELDHWLKDLLTAADASLAYPDDSLIDPDFDD